MRRIGLAGMAAVTLAAGLKPTAALAQHAGANAVDDADDAFGTNIGLESSGIYSENDTRGFSPTKAGNVRVDGIYIDTTNILAGRLRDRTAIRVGFAAQDYPFHAPTGIVDHKFRSFPGELGASFAWHQQAHGGFISEIDFRVPVSSRHLALTGGAAFSHLVQNDGSGNDGYGFTFRPIFRTGGVEFAPYVSAGGFRHTRARPLLLVNLGGALPAFPKPGRYFGQPWAKGTTHTFNAGATLKAALSDSLSLRGGLFRSQNDRLSNFSELYTLQPQSGLVSHRLIADPRQNVRSDSGEMQIAWRRTSGRWQHRLIAGYRMRDRHTDSGGSRVFNSSRLVTYGEFDPLPEQAFAFGNVNRGRVRQSAMMLGYTGKLQGLGTINLGVQKARYRGISRDGRTGLVTRTRDDPWLYNASLGLDLSSAFSLYLGSEKGLEDSGVAPENAINRAEQLPPTRTTQYEGGLRWKLPAGQLVVNGFQIEKPYFGFDGSGNFIERGRVRHRGIETSLSGHFGKRLHVVAGALFMRPSLSQGGRPVGTPATYVRADINYRTDILGGLTPLATVVYTGKRPVEERGRTLPGFATLDLGLRQQFHIGSINANIRAVAQNVFDEASWRVAAANTLYPDERRRFTISLTADF